jgi:hypothetical protein
MASSNEVINLHIQQELIFTDLLYTPFYSRNGIGRIGYLIKAWMGDKNLKIIMLRLVVFRLH